MFEDFEDEDVDVSPDSPDRAIVYAVWSRSDAASLTAEEAWAILHERYPDEPRFLLLEAYAELATIASQHGAFAYRAVFDCVQQAVTEVTPASA